jgi:hypothetical protein
MTEQATKPTAGRRYEVIFALPALLPFEDGYRVTLTSGRTEEGGVTTLTFRWVENRTSTPYLAMRTVASLEWSEHVAETAPGDAFRDRMTIVVASTPDEALWDDEPHEELTDPYFARILRLVDGLLEAYGLLSSQAVPRLSPTALFPIMLQRRVDRKGVASAARVVVLDTERTSRGRAHRLRPLSTTDINELARIGARLDRVRAGRPYYTAVRLLASAERALNAREPEAAIVSAASAVESMGSELLRSMAEEDGVAAPATRTAFKNVLMHHLLPRLGLSEEEDAVAHWLTVGYGVRHKVVHEGHRATLAEAFEATVAAGNISQHIDQVLIGLVSLYPRTAARKLGPSLLDRIQADGKLVAIVKEENASPILVGVVQDDARDTT